MSILDLAGGNVERKITPPIIHQTSQHHHSRRRLSLSTNSGPDPSPGCFEFESGKKARNKSRGMMSIFGSSYDNVDGRKSGSNHFSPVDDTLVENVAHVTKSPTKKLKKKKSRTKIPSKTLKECDVERLTLPNVTSRRHSVSVVITAPPIPTSVSPVSCNRYRRRSQGIAASTDYFNDIRRLSESGDARDENDVDAEECNTSTPYIRPPIVVVSSANRRKYSLQCDYDVR